MRGWLHFGVFVLEIMKRLRPQCQFRVIVGTALRVSFTMAANLGISTQTPRNPSILHFTLSRPSKEFLDETLLDFSLWGSLLAWPR